MQNLAQSIRRHASFGPDRVAIRFEADDPITYQALDRWIDELARQMCDQFDIHHGDRIAWLGFNHPAMVAMLYACARIGAVFVPVNWRLSNTEATFIIEDCAPKLLIYGEGYKDAATEAGRDICEVRSMQDLTTKTSNSMPFEGAGKLSDLLMIVYTSGTTGRPKGAMLGQESVYVNAINGIDAQEMRRSDKLLVNLPLFHVGGWNVQLTPGLFIGAEVILHEKFDPVAVSEAIITMRPSTAMTMKFRFI
jgi:fatty-acyl-CoA synthase